MSGTSVAAPASEVSVAAPQFNRWIPVIAGIAMQLCMGTAYIWSMFKTPLMKQFDWNNATAALPFAVLLGVLTLGSTIGGKLQDKYSPRPVILGGGIILGIGFMLTRLTSADTAWWLSISYGVIGGFGMGAIYSTTIACCQKWFPDMRGLITGIIVSALGLGGVVFTIIARALIGSAGPLGTLFWLGVIFLITCSVGALFTVNPPVGYKPAGWTPPAPKEGSHIHQDFSWNEVLKTPQFYMVIGILMLASAAGLMVIPFAKDLAMGSGLSADVAFLGVVIIGVFNSAGRLFWGWLSDKLGRRNTLLVLTLLAGASILAVNIAQGYSIFAIIAVVAFAYGGFLGVFPAITADFWGIKNMGMNYGMVLLGFGIGAIGATYLAGYIKDTQHDNLTLAFYIASAASFLGFLLVLLLKPPALKKAEG